MTVIPMFWLGYAGMPRRVLDFPSVMGGWHSVISAGHLLSIAGMIAFFIMIFDSLRQARAAIRNNFGISRFNTRLNFYIYEYARNIFNFQKSNFLFKYILSYMNYSKQKVKNNEHLETILLSYTFR
jgi:heme/copper-type cytochrome/quinol oxidase subunit 1